MAYLSDWVNTYMWKDRKLEKRKDLIPADKVKKDNCLVWGKYDHFFFVISDEEKISCYLQKVILISNKITLKIIKFMNLIDM